MANKSVFHTGLLERYLLTQILARFVAVSLVLGVLVSGRLMASLLNKVSGHSLPYDVFFELLFYGTVKALPLLLPFCMMAAILITFNKLYRDNEAYALYGIGIGYRNIYSVIIRFSIPLVIFLWAFCMHISPLLETRYETLKSEGRQRADTSVITPGRFVLLRDDLVLFIEHINKDGLRGIFSADISDGALNVEIARHGSQYLRGDQQLLLLRDGQRYLGSTSKQGLQVLRYDEHTIPLGKLKPRVVHERMAEKDFLDLLASDLTEDRAELQWRVSIPLAAFILTLLAFPLSFSSPRENRYVRVLLGIFFYVVYYGSLISITRAMAKGWWPIAVGVWPAHMVGAVLALSLPYLTNIKYFLRHHWQRA